MTDNEIIKAEIEKLDTLEYYKKILDYYALQFGTVKDKQKVIDEAKAEAVREFANYLQEELMYHIGRVAWLIEFGEDKEQTKYYQGVEKTLRNMNTLIDEKLKETVGDADGR